VTKYLGTSEAFTFEIPATETARDGSELDNPDDLPVRDYLYGSTVVDDLWTGMWGLVRLWGGGVRHLQPLGGDDRPKESITRSELHEMGHPAPHSDVDWTEKGQRAPDIYEDVEACCRAGLVCLEEAMADVFHALLPGDHDGEDLLAGFVSDLKEGSLEDFLRDNGILEELFPDDHPPFPADVDARHSTDGEPPATPDAAAAIDDEEDDADIREYDVTAFLTEIPYNDYGDHDPYGVVFALDQYVEEIKAGDRTPEPLFLRVNEGERLHVNLTNELPPWLGNDHPDPEMLIQHPWERSDRISLHSLALEYDVNAAAGVTAGFNHDTTVGPGETFTYEWTADGDVRTVCFWDMADLRSTRHHGAFGQVLVEPSGAIPLTPDTVEPAVHGVSALVSTADGTSDFREHGLLFADAQYAVNRFDPTDCIVPSPSAYKQASGGDEDKADQGLAGRGKVEEGGSDQGGPVRRGSRYRDRAHPALDKRRALSYYRSGPRAGRRVWRAGTA
jgi:hypothetical protein